MADHGQAQGGFARAGLADHFAGGNPDRDVLDDGCSRPDRRDGQALDDEARRGRGYGHAGISATDPVPDASAISFSARSMPSATRAIASVNVLSPTVRTAIRMAGATTAQGFVVRMIRFSLII